MIPAPPVVLAYGIGVDSTALLIEKHARGEAPDLCLSADTGVEKPATYAYLDVIRPWMRDRGIPFELVSYTPKRFKHWPPYYGILEMCLTNAVRRQNIRHNSRRRLAECGPRQGVDVRRRTCGAASADVRWSVA